LTINSHSFLVLGGIHVVGKNPVLLEYLIVCGSLLHLEMANSIPTQDFKRCWLFLVVCVAIYTESLSNSEKNKSEVDEILQGA
jgi:hypothetical protein